MKKKSLGSMFELQMQKKEEEEKAESPNRPDRRSIKQRSLADKFMNAVTNTPPEADSQGKNGGPIESESESSEEEKAGEN